MATDDVLIKSENATNIAVILPIHRQCLLIASGREKAVLPHETTCLAD